MSILRWWTIESSRSFTRRLIHRVDRMFALIRIRTYKDGLRISTALMVSETVFASLSVVTAWQRQLIETKTFVYG